MAPQPVGGLGSPCPPTKGEPADPTQSSTAEAASEGAPTEKSPAVGPSDLASRQVSQAANPPASPPASNAARPLDLDMETTMKRPTVRLQSMQQRAGAAGGFNPNRTHLAASRPLEGGLSNKERLLKAYQYQLAGSYDDAMQEYRIIIRNAPDLLGEVISNMRALLKLAPKYSAGYRVLGDAYMRQGEYLQAMEAYNKALTMAKKVKS
jgi:tetratricopeptide (TPR) repeat protein